MKEYWFMRREPAEAGPVRFEVVYEHEVNPWDWSYVGTLGRFRYNDLLAYQIDQDKGARVCLCVAPDDPIAKDILRVVALVHYDDGEYLWYHCEQDKFLPGKRCETRPGYGFVFTDEHKTETVLDFYEWAQGEMSRLGPASCMI